MLRIRPALVALAALLAFATLPAAAQTPDSLLGRWQTDVIGNLSFTQAGFQNWTEGGVNALSGTAAVKGKAVRATRSWQQTHEGRLAFGVVKQDTLAVRKAEDVIRFASNLQYQGKGFFRLFNPTVAATIRTQFAPGFNYDEDPLGLDRPLPAKVSDFFAPATLTQTIGLTYDPGPRFTQRVGIGAKETVVTIERLRPLYGLDLTDPVGLEAGIESVTEANLKPFENVSLTSTLSLFAAFNQPDKPDMLWENLVTMKVNSWLGVNFEFVAFYDRDRSNLIQLKEVLSVGVTVVFV